MDLDDADGSEDARWAAPPPPPPRSRRRAAPLPVAAASPRLTRLHVRRPPGAEDPTEADLPDFVPMGGEGCDTEPPLRRVRAPNDPLPYADDEGPEGPCFASQYQAEENDVGDSLGGAELKHAFRAMHELIDRHYARNTSNEARARRTFPPR